MFEKERYFLIADEKFLCSLDGNLIVASESVYRDFALPVLAQHVIAENEELRYWVISVAPQELTGYQWLGLRTHLGLVPEPDFQLAGRALQILRWHFDHQFCGRCGKPTEQHTHDLAKTCHSCKLDFYPRLSPCIITLITRGDYCLLAKHVRSSKDRYGCLAGFIEVGETPEQTVAREVLEEVNITINNIRYHASQPWPFPGQLMLGYFADYVAGDIVVDQQEILAATWFHYNELPNVPPIATISGYLIDAFVQQRKSFHSNKG